MSYGDGHSDSGRLGSGSSSGMGKSSRGKDGEPPNLHSLSAEPKYDLATIVQLVGVRSMVLWSWEQQFGIPAPARMSTDEQSSTPGRYSERDLVASLWLRDQILNGVAPQEAAAHLLEAQAHYPSENGEQPGVRQGPTQGLPLRAPTVTGPLHDSTFKQSRGPVTNRLNGGPQRGSTSRPLGLYTQPPDPSGGRLVGPGASPPSIPSFADPAPPGQTAGPMWSNEQSQPYGGASHPSGQWPQRGTATGALGQGALRSLPEPSASSPWHSQPQPSRGPVVSRPLARGATSLSAPLLQPPTGVVESAPTSSGVSWIGPGMPHAQGGELRALVPQLVRAFASFDTYAADRILREALSTRSIETVCIGLLLPAHMRTRDMWARRELTTPEERFSFTYLRGILYYLFHSVPERFDGPMVIVGCGPRETNDISSLILAVFWRRAGMRVVNLGPDVEASSLIDEIRIRRPALVALTISTSQRIRSLSKLTKSIMQMDGPRPVVGFAGPVFTRNPELQQRVSGVYLGDDAATATWHVANLLGTARYTVPSA